KNARRHRRVPARSREIYGHAKSPAAHAAVCGLARLIVGSTANAVHFAPPPRHSDARDNVPGGRTLTLITSTVDRSADEFRANQAAMGALVAELAARRAEAAQGGPARARERHLERGKLIPRDRVMRLIDPGSPFLELSPLAAFGVYDEPI